MQVPEFNQLSKNTRRLSQKNPSYFSTLRRKIRYLRSGIAITVGGTLISMSPAWGKQWCELAKVLTPVYVAFLLSGCASESVEQTEPVPISPSVPANKSRANSESSERLSPIIKMPTEVCQVSASVGAENSSGREGAVVVLPDTDQFQDAQLLYRVESTGSVIEVREIVFNSGAYSSGDYTFELHLQDGKSCRVPVSIRPSDIESRLKITLLVSVK